MLVNQLEYVYEHWLVPHLLAKNIAGWAFKRPFIQKIFKELV